MAIIKLEEAYQMGYATNDASKRRASGGSSNYLTCPTLCPTCRHLTIENSTSPFKCYASSASAANQAGFNNSRTYDGCAQYQAKPTESSRDESSPEGSSGGSIGGAIGKGVLKLGGKLIKGIWDGLGR